jgi:hypothetical protein
MRHRHHPTVRKRDDGWVVDCPECQRASREGVHFPVGIGILLESRLTAERVRENHAGPPVTAG